MRFFRRIQRGWEALDNKVRLAACSGAVVVILGSALLIALVPKAGNAHSAAGETAVYGHVTPGQLVEVMAPLTQTPELTPVPTPTPTPDPTLRRGMTSEAVQELQIRLMSLNYLDIDEPTLFYGPQTEAAVRLFQRQLNFTPEFGEEVIEDGIAGVQTLALLYADGAPKYVVKEGMSGTDITAMQEQLVDLGYMSKTTGLYGTETVNAIKGFQSRNKLTSDGLAGEQTFELLYSPDAIESASKTKQARTKANIETMISVAKKKLGCTYVLGARGPSKFDCSGLVYYCLNQAGSNRRRLNAAGYSRVSEWEKINSINSLKRGDLIFFYDKNFTKVGHVGIIISSTQMIDASSNRGKVVQRAYKTNYWKTHFVCGRRPW